MESIAIKNDIRKIIEKHSTAELPPYKIEFIPYMSDYESSKKELDSFPIQENTKQSIRKFIANVFFTEAPSDINLSSSKMQAEIEVIANSLYQSKPIPIEAQKIISQYIQSKKYRRALLKTINQMRLKGIFTLSKLSYQAIGDIMVQCLDVLMKEKDLESLRLCINLSQALYMSASEANKPRIFLQSYVHNHQIWKNITIWKDLIKHDVIEEMHNQKSYNIYKQETVEEKSTRIEGILRNSLNSFIYNMISFEVSPTLIRDIIDAYYLNAEINEIDKQTFEEVIVEYENDQKESTRKEVNKEPTNEIISNNQGK